MTRHNSESADRRKEQQALIAAANTGDPEAQSAMGDCCREGDEFTAKNDAEAMRWYHLAAEQGLPEAQNNIGAMHHNGIGVPKDAAEAARWYKLAADQGLGIAQNNLGLLYQAGLGVEANAEEALRLFKAAAQRGEVMAQMLVAAQIRGYLPRNTHHPKMLLPLPLPWPCPLDAAGSAISHGDDRFGRPQGFAAPCFARP